MNSEKKWDVILFVVGFVVWIACAVSGIYFLNNAFPKLLCSLIIIEAVSTAMVVAAYTSDRSNKGYGRKDLIRFSIVLIAFFLLSYVLYRVKYFLVLDGLVIIGGFFNGLLDIIVIYAIHKANCEEER